MVGVASSGGAAEGELSVPALIFLRLKILINGSFNWTRSASTVNEENITVLYDARLIALFTQEFESLWQASESS